MRKYIANIVTSFRILCSIILMFVPLFSIMFYILYLFCGFSDIIDGTIARKTNSSSEFGAKFDTVADFIFLAVSLLKLLPIIYIPKWLWIWIIAIAIIKTSNLICGFIYKKKFISVHSIMNKATGLILFLLPLTLQFVELKYSFAVVCSVATFSSIQEGYYIWVGKEMV